MAVHVQQNSSGIVVRKAESAGRPLLEVLTIDFGPLQLLGRFFAAATSELHRKGLSLRLATLDIAHAIHQDHIDSWPSYPPMLEPMLTGVRSDQSYSLVCQTEGGGVAAVMAGRIYDGDRSLASVLERQNFILEPGMQVASPLRFEVDGYGLEAIRTPFSYIGALWVNPTHRGNDLARLLPALTRAYALAKWGIQYDIGLANDDLMKIGMAAVYGYTKTDSVFRASGLDDGHEVTGRLLWMDREELEENLRWMLTERFSKVDVRSVNRATNEQS